MSPAGGRREAKKRATRAALRQAAAQLFAEQGYEATTVAQIASAAHAGERTFYRYFTGKEELLAERALEWIGTLHEAIRQRPAEETPYQAVARAMSAAVGELAVGQGAGAWILSEGPQPLALLRRVAPRPLRRLEQSVADAILHRTGAAATGTSQPPRTPAAEFEAQLLARVAVAALRTVVLHQREHGGAGARQPGIEQLLEDAFTRLTRLTSPQPFPSAGTADRIGHRSGRGSDDEPGRQPGMR